MGGSSPRHPGGPERIFFFQFLQAGGRWEEFLRDCPLHDTVYLRFYDEEHQSRSHPRWTLLLTRLLRRWQGGKWPPGLPDDA